MPWQVAHPRDPDMQLPLSLWHLAYCSSCRLNFKARTAKSRPRALQLRVVRLIPDDSGFGLGNSGFYFGLSISVCGCTAACVTCVARGFSSPCTFQATSISDAALQPQTQFTESIRNYNRIRNKNRSFPLRNRSHPESDAPLLP
jgi:hypothetical protein